MKIMAKTGMESMPENCDECGKQLRTITVHDYCSTEDGLKICPDNGRPEWCPLLEIPTDTKGENDAG